MLSACLFICLSVCVCLLVNLSILPVCLTTCPCLCGLICVYVYLCPSGCVITRNDHPFGCPTIYTDSIDNATFFVDTSTIFATTKHISLIGTSYLAIIANNVCLTVSVCVYLSVCLSARLLGCLSVCLCTDASVCFRARRYRRVVRGGLLVCLSVCLSVCLPVY